MFKKLLLLAGIGLGIHPLQASDSATEGLLDSSLIASLPPEELAYYHFLDSVNNALEYRTGEIIIGDGLATVDVPTGYRYLNGEQSDFILTEIWGNPPADNTLGMLFANDDTPFNDSAYAILISYSEEGFVEDEDAADLDYDELLETMQEDSKQWNIEREKMGYEPIEFIGWASTPYYDSEAKKLHWAKELKFGDDSLHTLNYDIRILGRKGYLELSFIGGMFILPEVQNNMENIIASVNFNSGNRYSDFNPEIDEVAAYGIGGLIAGKVLAKAGFFALLLKFWKIIAVGAIAAFAAVKRFLGFKKKEESPGEPSETSAN